MYKFATLLILAFLLFSLLAANDTSARPLQGAFSNTSSQATEFEKEVQGDDEAVVAMEDRCEGLSEDECLMRRSLVAHLDYIYTQKNNHP
ncbi:hypothetical protein QQ045_011966 [Rhodiola kirilowii]